jgi:hypothetical protein
MNTKNNKSYSLTCIGKQKSLRDIFAEKDELYKKKTKNEKFMAAFFRYKPAEKHVAKHVTKHVAKRKRKSRRTCKLSLFDIF